MQRMFITGGSGEIGKAIVDAFRNQSFDVIAPTRLELNLADINSIQKYTQTFTSPIDVFIHCAGFNEPKAIVNIEPEDFEQTLTINASSFYYLSRHLIKNNLIVRNGYLLGISSIYGSITRIKRLSYTAAKHCLNGMIKTLALELAPSGIKVNALAPGFVETRMTIANNSEEKIAELKKKIPLGKLAHPNDIAKTAYYLCSKENCYITGQTIIADGGYTIGGFESE